MVEEPDHLVPAFAEAGADHITVHVEAIRHLDRTLSLIRSLGKGAGVALNPATPVASIEAVLGIVDMVLVMTVNPGFGGQRFIGYTKEKIRFLRARIGEAGHDCRIEVDGGINLETAGEVVGAGAEVLVAGAAVFGGGDPASRVRELLEKASTVSYDSKCV
jgi:ribulose-phosphate 3-epimerase